MKIKLNKAFLILGIVFFTAFQSVQAVTPPVEKKADTTKIDASALKDEETEVIKRFNFKNKFHHSSENQIRTFYKKFSKYSEKNEIDKLKNMYSDSFVNNDGFDKNIIFKMMDDSVDTYKDITYKTDIEKIEVEGNYAVADIHENAVGYTTKTNDNTGDSGLLSSDVYYTDYLQKEGNKWKIVSSNIKSEKVMLKYGETKDIPIEIFAPKLVPADTEYDVTVKLTPPDGVMVMGSIVSEQIIYPQLSKKDVFKSVRSGELSRVIKSNNDNNNEYATVTIGITRASVEPPKLMFTMTGMAFIMTRINVVNKKDYTKKEAADVNTQSER